MVKAAAAAAVVLAASLQSVCLCVPRCPLLAELGSRQVHEKREPVIVDPKGSWSVC